MNYGLFGFPGTAAPNALVKSSDRRLPAVAGRAPVFAVRAWVYFNGTGTVSVIGSGNVRSITDNGVGDYTVNFKTAMPDANYAVAFGGAASAGVMGRTITSQTSTALRFVTRNTGNSDAVDDAKVHVTITR